MATQGEDNRSRTIASVEKGCRILECLHELEGATLSEVAEYMDLTPGTVHPHLVTLVENELAVRRDQKYYPSLRFLTIGKRRQQNNPLYRYAKEEIESLAEDKNARAQIYVEEFGRAVCIGIAGAGESILPPDNVGNHTPIHSIAAGKAILAALPDDRVEAIIDRHGLTRETEATIVDEDELRKELEWVDEKEYALNDEEYMRGLQAVGASVQDDDGTVLGAISLSKPTKETDETEFREELPQRVASAANRIELNIRVSRTG